MQFYKYYFFYFIKNFKPEIKRLIANLEVVDLIFEILNVFL